MAQFYTLEEAARVLGMSPEELKAKAQQREVRAFLDGGSWRFRVVDVDELARRRGLGSDAELAALGPRRARRPTARRGLDDLDLSEFQLGVAKPDLGAETMDLSADRPAAGRRGRLRPRHPARRPVPAPQPGDRLELGDHRHAARPASCPATPTSGSSPTTLKGAERLRRPAGLARPGPQAAERLRRHPDQADDTADHGFLTPPSGSGDTAVRPQPACSARRPRSPAGTTSDSDFELTPSSDLIDALQPESGSDFELTRPGRQRRVRGDPAAEPERLGRDRGRPRASRGSTCRGRATRGSTSRWPAGLDLGAADSIELAPLSDDEQSKADAPSPKPAAKAAPAKAKPSLAATPPPAVKKGEKDIFDDTDFEVDALAPTSDSDDQTVQLEAASDFELEESDTGSEVFAIDEEDVDQNAATAMAPSAFAEDEEEDDGFEEAVSSEMATRLVVRRGPTSPARSRRRPWCISPRGAPAEWGGLWVGLLGVHHRLPALRCRSSPIDLMRNLYDFQRQPPWPRASSDASPACSAAEPSWACPPGRNPVGSRAECPDRPSLTTRSAPPARTGRAASRAAHGRSFPKGVGTDGPSPSPSRGSLAAPGRRGLAGPRLPAGSPQRARGMPPAEPDPAFRKRPVEGSHARIAGQNRDLSERAVDDSRRLAQLEDVNSRLETSVQAYQDERSRLEAAYRDLRPASRTAPQPLTLRIRDDSEPDRPDPESRAGPDPDLGERLRSSGGPRRTTVEAEEASTRLLEPHGRETHAARRRPPATLDFGSAGLA